jgi:hypothetical protein
MLAWGSKTPREDILQLNAFLNMPLITRAISRHAISVANESADACGIQVH